MSSTTDRHGRSDLDARTDTGPGDGTAVQHGVATGDFDREIDLRRILWAGVWLVVLTLTSALLVWWFMRGLQVYDEHHEVKMMPMMARNPQQLPPGPRLQPEDPKEDRNQDMADMRAAEDQSLEHAGWVDQPGGTLRVPVDVAIDAILQRGVAPFTAAGATGAAGAPAVSMTQTPIEIPAAPTAPAPKPPVR
ncbi:MAG: hypothetical protein ABIS20_25725 [Thermoanaerobaculia bacterium]